MHRSLRLIGTAALALVAVAACAAPSWSAEAGTFSIGGNFGTGIYSNSDINDALELQDIEEISSGWEYGGSLRYQASPRLAIDLEANLMKPASTTEIPGESDLELSTPGLAIPLSLYYTLSENDQYRFNLFGGAGLVTGAKGKEEGGGGPDVESESGSGFYGHAGLEAQWMLSPQFALGARVLGRTAKADVEGDTPDDDFEIDYTGVAFGLGARLSFGGGGE
jgi:hypothetical protein